MPGGWTEIARKYMPGVKGHPNRTLHMVILCRWQTSREDGEEPTPKRTK